ncbi:SIR2 family protein [Cribrihabitans neustonicus]|uniref:SIR2 family protein n=1 Tax=Cribrihabitans neustonicus TaxID=1429085 RepID=UPI003B5B1A0C
MKLLPDGPDIPQELIAAQEKGEVLFICGAGVSMTVGLPSFRGLVAAVYGELGENWHLHPAEREVMEQGGRLAGQYDRVLRLLERRLTAVGTGNAGRLRERLRDAIRIKLQLPQEGEVNLEAHAALLDLSRDSESQIRLVTTNFDTLFERAWPRGGRAPSFAGPAMPQPKTAGCAGVMHLHGRLADEHLGLSETDLVLTSAEFGDAYLRSGWASRYVYDLVRAYTVVLVGYQADDPPMRYLLEVLEADRQRYSDLR